MERPVSYSIKDIIKATGKSRRVIIYYEDRGLLPTPKRDSNGDRVYYEEDIPKYIEFFQNKEGKD